MRLKGGIGLAAAWLGAVACLWAGDPGPYPREDRQAARIWYLRGWPQGRERSEGFTGDVAKGVAGDTSAAWKNAMETRLNTFRRLAGLQPVVGKVEYHALAQAGAALLATQAVVTHAPPKEWRWWTEAGFQGCQQSLISFDNGLWCPVEQLIYDGNEPSLGHRSALLTPGLKFVGFGAAPNDPAVTHHTDKDMQVLVHASDASLVDLDPKFTDPFVLWPARGYFPKALMQNQWTIEVADGLGIPEPFLKLSDVVVTIERNGKLLPIVFRKGPGFIRVALDGDITSWGGLKADGKLPTPLIYSVPAPGGEVTIGEVTGHAQAPADEDPFGDVMYRVKLSGIKVRATGALYQGTGTYEYEVMAFDHQAGPPLEGQARLINLSTRSPVRTGSGVQVGGFVVTGTKSKRYLVRGSGPALAPFQVGGLLRDPLLELHRLLPNGGAEKIAQNDDWSSEPEVADLVRQLASRTGAFAWAEGSRDAAVVVTLAPGNYTATVSGKNGEVGNGMVEIYDADTNETAHGLGNISSRTYVGADGDAYQIAGFVLQGDLPRTVFIRATGLDLERFGVTDVLVAPWLDLYDGQILINSTEGINVLTSQEYLDDYQSGSHFERRRFAERLVGAFASQKGGNTAAMILTLSPGHQYTAVVKASRMVEKKRGNALVEVYEMP